MPVRRFTGESTRRLFFGWLCHLAGRFDERHRFLRRLLRIHEHGAAGEPLAMRNMDRRFPRMTNAPHCLAEVNPVIGGPVLFDIRLQSSWAIPLSCPAWTA